MHLTDPKRLQGKNKRKERKERKAALPDEEKDEKMQTSDCCVDILSLAKGGPLRPGNYGLRDLDLNRGNRSCTRRQAPREASK